MKIKKIPMRTCVVTKEKLPKRELIRIVKDKENNIIVDETGKVNGRGAYLKLDLDVIEKAKRTKVLDRHLQAEVKDEIFEQLKQLL